MEYRLPPGYRPEDELRVSTTAANIQWNQVMSNFEIQWKALKDRKDEDDPDVPKITKALPNH